MRVVVVIPTYNERDNIVPLIDALHVQFYFLTERHLNITPEILIVDDNSPDGTGSAVRRMQKQYPGLHLIEGEKFGLGAAYIRGMTYAMRRLAADVIFEMDADFSHRPEDIPRLLDSIISGADFAIGSRYIDGGAIPADWGWLRRLNSQVGNLVARHAAGIIGVRDCTAGFRAIRTHILKRIDISRLGAKGYVFQIALLSAALQHEARVVEVPVDFVDRTHGTSKLRLKDIVEFIWHVFLLRLQKSEIFLKFALIGILGVGVNLGAFTWLLHLGCNRYLASPLAVELAIASNFLFNNYWTFSKQKQKTPMHFKWLKFNLVSLMALAVNTLTFFVSSRISPHMLPQFSQLAGIVPAWLVNYRLNVRWTFS